MQTQVATNFIMHVKYVLLAIYFRLKKGNRVFVNHFVHASLASLSVDPLH